MVLVYHRQGGYIINDNYTVVKASKVRDTKAFEPFHSLI